MRLLYLSSVCLSHTHTKSVGNYKYHFLNIIINKVLCMCAHTHTPHTLPPHTKHNQSSSSVPFFWSMHACTHYQHIQNITKVCLLYLLKHACTHTHTHTHIKHKVSLLYLFFLKHAHMHTLPPHTKRNQSFVFCAFFLQHARTHTHTHSHTNAINR